MSSPANLFADVLTRYEATGASADVTHYTLSLGSANATTGIYAESYTAGTTISMPLFPKGSERFLLGTGLAIRKDALGITDTAVAEGDKIKDSFDDYYRVVAVKRHPWGDVSVYFEVDLVYNPFNY